MQRGTAPSMANVVELILFSLHRFHGAPALGGTRAVHPHAARRGSWIAINVLIPTTVRKGAVRFPHWLALYAAAPTIDLRNASA